MFDTFYDRRSGFLFYTNPLGARADYSVVDEGGSNTDWNPVWSSKTGRFEGGWTVEMAIPFKSLRYRAGPNQVWGIQLRRAVRRKNEWAYLTPVPQILAGPQAFNRISSGGTLVGLDLPAAGKNLELKPYAISRVTTDRLRTPPILNDLGGDVGGDVKYGVTPNLTADFTINTDFAQVEIDEQQVNLTRFSLFFPEKRDFFLEGRGIFDFARGGAGAQQGTTTTDTPYLFYSRRIGLNRNRIIPIDVGGRLTGKVGSYGVGVMNIQTGDESVSRTEPTNFTVVRVKTRRPRRSAIGAMMTNRSLVATAPGSNQAYGVDGAFSFFQNLSTGVYWAKTTTDGREGDDQSYQGRVDYNADRYGARAEFLSVGRNFNPEVGFLRRIDFSRSFGQLRFSPRPKTDEERPEVHLGRQRRIHRQRRRAPWKRACRTCTSARSSRTAIRFRSRSHATTSCWYSPSPCPARRDRAPRRVHVQRRAGVVRIRRSAADFGDGRRAGRAVLRRHDYGAHPGDGRDCTPARISVLKQFSVEPTYSVSHIELPAAPSPRPCPVRGSTTHFRRSCSPAR